MSGLSVRSAAVTACRPWVRVGQALCLRVWCLRGVGCVLRAVLGGARSVGVPAVCCGAGGLLVWCAAGFEGRSRSCERVWAFWLSFGPLAALAWVVGLLGVCGGGGSGLGSCSLRAVLAGFGVGLRESGGWCRVCPGAGLEA